jgi:hypothetical protein
MTTLGRPPLRAEERLSESIAVLVSRAMREDLEAQAKASGYRSLSRFIREKKLSAPTAEDGTIAR